jgi:hypothetical protein
MKRGTLAGLVTGFLVLTALEAFLTGPQTTGAGSMLRGIGDLARRWSDPTVPAIPDLRKSDPPSTSSPASTRPPSRLPSTVPA